MPGGCGGGGTDTYLAVLPSPDRPHRRNGASPGHGPRHGGMTGMRSCCSRWTRVSGRRRPASRARRPDPDDGRAPRPHLQGTHGIHKGHVKRSVSKRNQVAHNTYISSRKPVAAPIKPRCPRSSARGTPAPDSPAFLIHPPRPQAPRASANDAAHTAARGSCARYRSKRAQRSAWGAAKGQAGGGRDRRATK
jgi:hypothetical protein